MSSQKKEQASSCLKVNEASLRVEPACLHCSNGAEDDDDDIGLLSKIVNVIKQEPFSTEFR